MGGEDRENVGENGLQAGRLVGNALLKYSTVLLSTLGVSIAYETTHWACL